ncbi:hypothetical protein A0H81_05768 [Grifola frondosa]|uniref:Gal80p-like C-terminal domain-containing protein n=1 Tax=Grifola frondosa TaxID=5627 RepID=A0A1C7MBL9_GRIFR|nr:hypothetical protein A0H81_05768 [Grifola frondosa]
MRRHVPRRRCRPQPERDDIRARTARFHLRDDGPVLPGRPVRRRGREPDERGVKSNSADQLAFTGILRDSGAILTATWRGGISTTTLSDKGTPSLLWIIDGDKGHIRVESTAPTGIFLQSFMPDKVFLNGEEVNVLEEDTLSNTGRAFEEFAKGSEGIYPTFDDAVVFKRHVDAFARSAKEGRTIRLDA